ncbi:hypothetical protein LZ24_02407 [Desulfobotulus alkaliphilus]|uniref:Uncharacterized protein n=1 Tax=Desulfobotulus alkaliphilus TaxID=622671 RepID=A0A562RJ17_9BACT|nr:hypothetical protein [Desulfobotulus alkaliphilus]TWI68933.1 hypothetical protein LZ24_02407 [Desulfobotulus alkaliphilus]
MSAADNRQSTGWFQFPGFDIASFITPGVSFNPLQDWLKGQQPMDTSSIWPNPSLMPDFNKAGMEWYTLATEQVQTVFEEYWKLMGLVPKNEYDRLLEQYKAIKQKIEEEQKKNKQNEQTSSRLKEAEEALRAAETQIKTLEKTEKALKAAEAQIKNLEEDLKKKVQPEEKKEAAKTQTAKS